MNLEVRIPAKHPLRRILALADDALRSLSGEFSAIYALTGRSSIPPERLLRALLLQAFRAVLGNSDSVIRHYAKLSARFSDFGAIV